MQGFPAGYSLLLAEMASSSPQLTILVFSWLPKARGLSSSLNRWLQLRHLCLSDRSYASQRLNNTGLTALTEQSGLISLHLHLFGMTNVSVHCLTALTSLHLSDNDELCELDGALNLVQFKEVALSADCVLAARLQAGHVLSDARAAQLTHLVSMNASDMLGACLLISPGHSSMSAMCRGLVPIQGLRNEAHCVDCCIQPV